MIPYLLFLSSVFVLDAPRRTRYDSDMTFPIEQLKETADAAQAIAWLRGVAKAIGPGFHPDTPGADYIHGETKKALFTPEEAQRLDADLARVFVLLESAGKDPYAIAGRVQRRLLGMPYPE